MVYKFFPGKKSFLSSTFQYLNYNSRPLGLPPKRTTFQFPNTSYSSIFSAHAHDWLGNCRTFQRCSFVTIHFVFSFICSSCDLAVFGSTSTKRPIMPSRRGSLKTSFESTCDSTKCIINWEYVIKQSSKLYRLKRPTQKKWPGAPALLEFYQTPTPLFFLSMGLHKTTNERKRGFISRSKYQHQKGRPIHRRE